MSTSAYSAFGLRLQPLLLSSNVHLTYSVPIQHVLVDQRPPVNAVSRALGARAAVFLRGWQRIRCKFGMASRSFALSRRVAVGRSMPVDRGVTTSVAGYGSAFLFGHFPAFVNVATSLGWTSRARA
jgi:hypothetical protein